MSKITVRTEEMTIVVVGGEGNQLNLVAVMNDGSLMTEAGKEIARDLVSENMLEADQHAMITFPTQWLVDADQDFKACSRHCVLGKKTYAEAAIKDGKFAGAVVCNPEDLITEVRESMAVKIEEGKEMDKKALKNSMYGECGINSNDRRMQTANSVYNTDKKALKNSMFGEYQPPSIDNEEVEFNADFDGDVETELVKHFFDNGIIYIYREDGEVLTRAEASDAMEIAWDASPGTTIEFPIFNKDQETAGFRHIINSICKKLINPERQDSKYNLEVKLSKFFTMEMVLDVVNEANKKTNITLSAGIEYSDAGNDRILYRIYGERKSNASVEIKKDKMKASALIHHMIHKMTQIKAEEVRDTLYISNHSNIEAINGYLQGIADVTYSYLELDVNVFETEVRDTCIELRIIITSNRFTSVG